MTEEERVRAFLEELAVLTRKHNIYIWGCGCCGTPRVCVVPEGKALSDPNYGYLVCRPDPGVYGGDWSGLKWSTAEIEHLDRYPGLSILVKGGGDGS